MSADKFQEHHVRDLGNPESLRFPKLALPYDELQSRNKGFGEKSKESGGAESEVKNILKENPGIRWVHVSFTNLEGRLHTIKYSPNQILEAGDNLTFDGSSIDGFQELGDSDLRLAADWDSFKFVPADIYGPGVVAMMGFVQHRDKTPYEADFRGLLAERTKKLKEEEGMTLNTAPEIEGFLMEGVDAEQNYDDKKGFTPAGLGIYMEDTSHNELGLFLTHFNEALEAMGIPLEKMHTEVAPGQFEVNMRYADAMTTADRVLWYQRTARLLARKMGYTATFLPKPVDNQNGSGMHTNFSLEKNGVNIFHDAESPDELSETGRFAIAGVLDHAKGMTLIHNPSVLAVDERFQEGKFEAPVKIKSDDADRGAVVRRPEGNDKTARGELRAVAPDANPHMSALALLESIVGGLRAENKEKLMALLEVGDDAETLPTTFKDALKAFEESEFTTALMGEEVKKRYLDLKKEAASYVLEEANGAKFGQMIRSHHSVRHQGTKLPEKEEA